MQHIIYTLLNYLNCSIKQDTNYNIALCLLDHLRSLPDLSLQEASDLCHVSIATLNRFCKTIGFDNYSTLREHASHGQQKYYPPKYNDAFLSRLLDNLNAIENIPLSIMDRAIDRIYQAKEICLLGYGDFQFEALYFQKHLFSHGKYAKIYSDAFIPIQALSKLQKNDLIILTSMQLEYMQLNSHTAHQTLLSSLKCQKILITQSKDEKLLALFDVVLPCGPQINKELNTYTIMHMYDCIISRYHEKYHPHVYE